jgi:chromosome segregation ATPase
MASLPFGGGGGGQGGGEITRDQLIVIVSQTQVEVKGLTQAVQDMKASMAQAIRDLKASVEEMVDRVEADTDELRKKIDVLGDLANDQRQLTSGQKASTDRIKALEDALALMKEWKNEVTTTIRVVGAFSTLAGGAVGVVVAHLWK